jgi:hypothetical protein
MLGHAAVKGPSVAKISFVEALRTKTENRDIAGCIVALSSRSFS